MDPGECACSACPATPTGGRFGPAWLQVTLRPPCPATSVSVGTELPGDRSSPGEARAEGPGRGSARGCGTGSRVAPGVTKLARTRGGRGRCVQHAPGCLEACRASGASSCEVIQSFAFLTFGGTVAGSLGSCWVPLSGLDSRAQSGRPASIYAGGSLVLCLGSLWPA